MPSQRGRTNEREAGGQHHRTFAQKSRSPSPPWMPNRKSHPHRHSCHYEHSLPRDTHYARQSVSSRKNSVSHNYIPSQQRSRELFTNHDFADENLFPRVEDVSSVVGSQSTSLPFQYESFSADSDWVEISQEQADEMEAAANRCSNQRRPSPCREYFTDSFSSVEVSPQDMNAAKLFESSINQQSQHNSSAQDFEKKPWTKPHVVKFKDRDEVIKITETFTYRRPRQSSISTETEEHERRLQQLSDRRMQNFDKPKSEHFPDKRYAQDWSSDRFNENTPVHTDLDFSNIFDDCPASTRPENHDRGYRRKTCTDSEHGSIEHRNRPPYPTDSEVDDHAQNYRSERRRAYTGEYEEVELARASKDLDLKARQFRIWR